MSLEQILDLANKLSNRELAIEQIMNEDNLQMLVQQDFSQLCSQDFYQQQGKIIQLLQEILIQLIRQFQIQQVDVSGNQLYTQQFTQPAQIVKQFEAIKQANDILLQENNYYKNLVLNSQQQKVQQCPYCTKKFCNIEYLRQHVNRRHQQQFSEFLNTKSQEIQQFKEQTNIPQVEQDIYTIGKDTDQYQINKSKNKISQTELQSKIQQYKEIQKQLQDDQDLSLESINDDGLYEQVQEQLKTIKQKVDELQ